jgi:hypothetical protein
VTTTTTPPRYEEARRHGYDPAQGHYVIIHPLDDVPEEKIDTASLGPMAMNGAVRWSLLSLRGYLIVMFCLVLYRIFEIAGLFGGAR